MTSINDDLRANAGMRPLDRAILIVIAVLVISILAFGWFVGLPKLENLNEDDELIDRNAQIDGCVGIRQDYIDKWRAVATFEFTHQVDRSTEGLPIDTALAERSEQAIYDLVDSKQEIRAEKRHLIETDAPIEPYECAPVPEGLMPPPLDA